MAPAIKELSRWLDANSEYYVAPDWADVVKHSVSNVSIILPFSQMPKYFFPDSIIYFFCPPLPGLPP